MSNPIQTNVELMKFDGKPSWAIAFPQPFYFGLEFHMDAIIMMVLMYIRCEMTPASSGGEQQISISGGCMS